MPAQAGISTFSRYARTVAQGGGTYIMASKARGMLYTGVTAYLAARVDQHRRDVGSAYCRRYGIKLLVLAEWHDAIEAPSCARKR